MLDLNLVSQEGFYVIYVSAYKHKSCGTQGDIQVYKNGGLVQSIYESDAENYHMMNAVFTLHLQKGDEVKLYNYYDDSIYVRGDYPFTFTGYKI